MTLDEARDHIGEAVAWRIKGMPARYGVIIGAGNVAAFVRYEGERHTTVADPADLTLITPEDDEDDPEDASLRLEAAEERAFNAPARRLPGRRLRMRPRGRQVPRGGGR